MVFINNTGIIGVIMGRAVQTTSGSLFIALLMILLVILAIAFMFGIPLEFTSVLLLPLLLAYASYYSNFIAPLIVALIYLAAVLAQKSMFSR